MTETNETGPHPWYGPCDALGQNGDCGECEKQGVPGCAGRAGGPDGPEPVPVSSPSGRSSLTQPSEMVERVARAIFRAQFHDGDAESVVAAKWKEWPEVHDNFRRKARGAIAAMREPTEAARCPEGADAQLIERLLNEETMSDCPLRESMELRKEAASSLRSYESRLSQAREALEPFARFARIYPRPRINVSATDTVIISTRGTEITLADLDRALSALKEASNV